jgi:hypothetical protein
METVIDWSKKPDGATHYAPAGDDLALRWFNMDKGEFGASWIYGRWYLFDRPSNRDDMVEIKAPWTGAGLPPVGTVCEYTSNGGLNWRETSVLFIDEQVVLLTGYALYKLVDPDIAFRPIRTPEQIAEEKRKSEVDALIDVLRTIHTTYYPEVAEAILKSGYRLQVQP